MESDAVDEADLFRAIAQSGAQALLIGRQALIMLGLPLMTRDFDYWIRHEDIERFNGALLPLGLHPTHSPEQARARGRYVLENGEHVDVMVVREAHTQDGAAVRFESLWEQRQVLDVGSVEVVIPSIEGLILTKQLGGRPKDAEDIRMLRVLQSKDGEPR